MEDLLDFLKVSAQQVKEHIDLAEDRYSEMLEHDEIEGIYCHLERISINSKNNFLLQIEEGIKCIERNFKSTNK